MEHKEYLELLRDGKFLLTRIFEGEDVYTEHCLVDIKFQMGVF